VLVSKHSPTLTLRFESHAGDHTPLALKANDVGGQVAYVGFDNDDPALARLVADLACGVPARTTTR
jgi:hypothetical protein